jgi:hypothetical protein
MNPTFDQIFLRNKIVKDEEDRRFRCRMDELKDQEQRTMWSFIRECIRGRNRKARDKIEAETDLERRTNAVKRCS